MTRLVEQAKRRSENADYLTKLLKEIPGIKPAKLYKGVTRSAYHLYMFRYDKEEFAGMDRSKFLKALSSEGYPLFRRLRKNKQRYLCNRSCKK